jgi:hypothetical protein
MRNTHGFDGYNLRAFYCWVNEVRAAPGLALPWKVKLPQPHVKEQSLLGGTRVVESSELQRRDVLATREVLMYF